MSAIPTKALVLTMVFRAGFTRNNNLVPTVSQDQQANTLPSALYVVAMPIGQWSDLSSRAIEVLGCVDVILAEDTRVSGQILKSVGVSTRMVSLNAHSEAGKADRVIESLESGQSLALISDAGTPGISDPGRLLVDKVVEKGFQVVPVPGPSALTAALSVSGLPAAPSHFFGFLSTKSSARDHELERALSHDGTLIFYEAPHRIVDFAERLDQKATGRKVVFARELTKTHEQLIRVAAGECADWFVANPDRIRGEFVVLVGPVSTERTQLSVDADQILRVLARELPPSKAAALTSELTGVQKRILYRQLTGEPEA
ncbi:MAG: 16S rRNA (cytidine(1402)-2'-O)-methyltransferase [Gammaproteobacteria bacterium]|nr:16S rRNA (cytidine(1402)-2'-O)-methyltransferase [Gammaproteobacteria bacterium]